MAASKLAFLLLFSAIIGTLILPRNVVAADSSHTVSYSSLQIELDNLNSKVTLLESRIDEADNDMKRKDESIEQLENVIHERSNAVDSLKDEVQLLQEKGSLDAKYEVVKAYARAGDLEKQVDALKKEIETQTKKKATLESRLSIAEKKVQDLNLKLENLLKINDEQKSIIRKTERALQVAEEEMVRAKMEVAGISKEVKEVHQSWIPPWLAVHFVRSQSFIITQWNERGRPAVHTTIEKALEKKGQFVNWAEPHIVTIRTEWIPTIKSGWFAFVTSIEPSFELLTAKVVDVYHASKKTIGPHIVKAQQTLDPYFKEAEKFSRPYVNHISITMKPHVDKARVLLKPYTKKVVRGYKKFKKAIPVYHRQVKVTIHELLKSQEFTKPIATTELAWYMASAVMALPVIILFNLISAVFSKKPKKRTRSSHSSHTRRRAKRVHPDK